MKNFTKYLRTYVYSAFKLFQKIGIQKYIKLLKNNIKLFASAF